MWCRPFSLPVSIYPAVLKYFHIDDFKATKTSPQGAYFHSQKPLSTVRGIRHNILFVKLSQQIHNNMSMISPEETMLMTARML